jgi:signal transduction histidine kinase
MTQAGIVASPARHFAIAVGVTVVALGALILAGWVGRSTPLVQPIPGLAPAYPLAAIIYISAGVAVAAVATGLLGVARLATAVVLVIAALVAFEHLTDVSLGIDALLVPQGFLPDLPVAPHGRVALVTSLLAVSTGLGIACLTPSARGVIREGTAGLLGLGVVATVGLILLLRLAPALTPMLGVELSRVSPLTIVVFLLMGSAVTGLAWEGRASPLATTWGALAVGLVPLSITVVLWWNITELENRRVVAQVNREAVTLGYQLGRDLDGLLATMGRFAEREAHRSRGPAEDEARLRDADAYLRDFPSVDWVALIDSAGWLWTLAARSGQAPDSRVQQVARGSLMERLRSVPGSTIVSVPPVGPGEQDLIAASPICRAGTGGATRPGSRNCVGFALAGLKADRLISNSLTPQVSGLFVTVRSGGDTLYRSSGARADTRLKPAIARLDIGGRVWEVSALPRAAETARRRTPIAVMVLLLGGTTSALLLLSLRFAGLARERAERVERQREELAASEQRFRGVFDSSFQFQALLDLDCKVMELNRHGLGATEGGSDCVGREMLWSLPIWRDSPAAVEWLRGACGRAKDGRTTSGVLELVEPDGTGRVYEATIRPLTGADGQVSQLVLEAQDITQMRRAEESIRELETLSTMGRLAARVAHEINNPLQGIQNGFQLIKGAIDPAHPHFRFVGAIEREITRIAGVTRQLYDAYRPDEESQRACSIPLMLSDVTVLMSQVNREAGVELVTEHDESVREPVPVSDTLLRQIVMNLAQNAIDATPRGGVVTMSASRSADLLALTVRDSGPGVPDHLRTRLFEPFFSTKSGRATSGMGLGLTLVRRATIALGGTIELQDGNRGGGATFVVQIPVPSVPAGSGEADGVVAGAEVQAPLPAGVTLSPQRAGVAPVQLPAPPA